MREIAAAEDAVVVPVCAAIESELSELEDEDKLEFYQVLTQSNTGELIIFNANH